MPIRLQGQQLVLSRCPAVFRPTIIGCHREHNGKRPFPHPSWFRLQLPKSNVANAKRLRIYLYHLIFLLLIFLGHIEVVKFLIEACKVNPFVKDR